MKIWDHGYHKRLVEDHGRFSIVPYTLPVNPVVWFVGWAIIGLILGVLI